MNELDRLKQDGEAADWLDDAGYATLKAGYLLKNETPRSMYKRIAKAAAAQYKDGKGWEKKFFDAFWSNWLCCSSPILANLGSDRGMPISCFSIDVSDSVNDIFMKNHELAMLSKSGGGVGISLSRIRARGEDIKGNGKSEGIVPWAKLFDTSVNSVSQGGTRKGAAAVYLDIDHGDVDEFMNIRRPTGDPNRRCHNLNHGVCITDDWMNSMMKGDKAKQKTWRDLLLNRVETGEPYLFFTDNVNNQSPECYKANDLNVSTSNICCLSGDTEVLTSEGIRRIDSLIGETVNIWDGNSWVENSSFEKRGEDKLIRVHIKDGSIIDSNANHRWFVATNHEDDYKLTLTKDLEEGDFIEPHYENNDHESGWNRIVQIEEIEGIHPVYCPNLPTTGKFGLANGLMTGNTEIMLYTDKDHTFVCCLSSLNLVRYDEWKDTDLVEIAIRFLDAVLSEYIAKSEGVPGLEASRRSAIKGRAIGIGVLGWHTLLQEKGIAFDSFEAMQLNNEIFKLIHDRSEKETAILAKELGEPEWCKGFNRRNSHLQACAPTVSNSTISGGMSAGIEPIAANIFSQKSAKGTFIRKNRTLEVLLEKKSKNTPEVWKSINEFAGSVQHLAFLSDKEKLVFLTAREINQHAIINQAAQRQRWIDQGQSVNLFFASNASPQYIHDVHISAWRQNLKTLYYMRSEGVLRGDLASRSKDECEACGG